MSRTTGNWGFPRWGEYGQDRDTVSVRMCDFHGCDDKADHPAPKSPNSPEKWWFCENHAAEYNKGWNYFEGLSSDEAKERARTEARDAGAFTASDAYGWGGAHDGDGWTQAQREALAVLELDNEADVADADIKASFRKLAKRYHPDRNRGNEADRLDAEQNFQRVRAAYDLLSTRRPGK